MKTIIFILSAILWLPSFGQMVNSSCNSIDRLKYKNDADQLAIRLAATNPGSMFYDSVSIHQDNSLIYLDALTAVYNATQIPERDLVIDTLDIHTIPTVEMNNLILSADSNLSWMNSLRDNIYPTGDPDVDYLISKYQIKTDHYFRLPYTPLHTVAFKTDSNFNILNLGRLWKKIPGVGSAGENQSTTDGNDIYDTITPNYVQLTYYQGYENCWEGCLIRHYWTFRVYTDCSVEFMGGYPVDLQVIKNDIAMAIYPNPTDGKISLSGIGPSVIISVINSLGQEVVRIEAQGPFIDITALPAGVYWILINGWPLGKKIIKN